jgi:hypothetical protein
MFVKQLAGLRGDYVTRNKWVFVPLYPIGSHGCERIALNDTAG